MAGISVKQTSFDGGKSGHISGHISGGIAGGGTISDKDSVVPGNTSGSLSRKKVKKSAGAFRTISEVAELLGVQQHVLRFWETKFSQVRPMKRGGGRRYYRPEDVRLLQHIHKLLYTDGYTIKGAQKLLKGQGKSQILANLAKAEEQENRRNRQISGVVGSVPAGGGGAGGVASDSRIAKARFTKEQRQILEEMLAELKELKALINS